MNFLPFAQVEKTFWNAASGSSELYIKLIVGFLVGVAAMAALLAMPARGRRPVVVTVTFLAGLYYVLFYLWPRPLPSVDADAKVPRDAVEGVGFWLADALPVVASFSNILSAFLLGLGVFSILRIHLRKFARRQTDWGFSAVLLISMVAMVIFGYWDWYQQRIGPNAGGFELQATWGTAQYGRDLLFQGLLQQMDSAMFSIIAFFILSAAYRAFRVRSVEATILLGTALIVMMSLMGVVSYFWGSGIDAITGGNPNSVLENFKLTEMASWLRDNVQSAALRGIDFGVGIGALAMGLRLWLSLEKGGVSQ